jgi:hypothetical protein
MRQLLKHIPTKDNVEGFRWKCRGHKCNKSSVGVRKGSFFKKSKLKLKTLIMLIFECSRDASIKELFYQYNIVKKL